MKRFLVFGFDGHYPGGGLDDIQGDFEKKEDAIAYADSIATSYRIKNPEAPRVGMSYEYVQVFDCEIREKIYEIN